MKKPAIISVIIYLGIAILLSILFFVGTFTGNYTLIERIGGSFWVFLLSTIILMPIVIPWIKRKFTA